MYTTKYGGKLPKVWSPLEVELLVTVIPVLAVAVLLYPIFEDVTLAALYGPESEPSGCARVVSW